MEEKVRKLTLRRLKEEVKTLENVFSEVRILRADQVCAGFSDCSYKSGEARCYEIWKKKQAVPQLYKLPRSRREKTVYQAGKG